MTPNFQRDPMAPASVDFLTWTSISIHTHTKIHIIKNINLKKIHSNFDFIGCLRTGPNCLGWTYWDLSIVCAVGWPKRDSDVWWLSNRLLAGVKEIKIMWAFHSSHAHYLSPETASQGKLRASGPTWKHRFPGLHMCSSPSIEHVKMLAKENQ